MFGGETAGEPVFANVQTGSRGRSPHRLFADKMQHDVAGVTLRAVFPQINPLPRSQRELSGADGKVQIHRRQCRADVRGHVVVAFRRVDKQRVAVRHEPLEKRLQIAAHIRVGIFLDEQRSRRVLQMNREQTVVEFILREPFFHLARELVKPASARGNRQLLEKLAQHFEIILQGYAPDFPAD
jgi:hypothetical protein